MKKKILGIFVCMLLITSTAIPVIGIRNDKMNNRLYIDVDKKQGEQRRSCIWNGICNCRG